MFGTVHIGSKKLTIFSIGCFLLFLAVCAVTLRAAAPDTVMIGGEPYPLAAEDEEQVQRFIAACGDTAGKCIKDETVTVPLHWNDVYTAYADLQRGQGMDLTPYKGKKARQLTYALKDSEDFAVVLVSDGRIIAAHRTAMRQGETPRALIGSIRRSIDR